MTRTGLDDGRLIIPRPARDAQADADRAQQGPDELGRFLDLAGRPYDNLYSSARFRRVVEGLSIAMLVLLPFLGWYLYATGEIAWLPLEVLVGGILLLEVVWGAQFVWYWRRWH